MAKVEVMRGDVFWWRAGLLVIFVLVVGSLSCGLTAAVHPRDPAIGGRPEVFIEATRILENAFWDADNLKPQVLLRGAVEGVKAELRHRGGDIEVQDQQLIVSRGGQSRIINLSSVNSIPTVIQAFSQVHGFLQHYPHLEGDRAHWEYRGIEGMLKTLDGNSAFMTPEEFREMQQETKGSYGGVGIRIGMEGGELIVVEPLEGTPAFRAGLKQGDRIVKIDGHPTKGLTLQQAVRRVRGPVGSVVVLSIVRSGSDAVQEVSLTRGKIERQTVESRQLDGHIGYLRVGGFSETTLRETEKALNRLTEQKLEGLILDLRSNPGGLLSQSVSLCKLFVEEGAVVVSTEGRLRNQNTRFIAYSGGPYRHYPLIVLINAGSASGSEIVAGALQDLQRATIIGTKSYGKGSVQTIFPLQDGSGLRLTTAHYFTSGGRNIEGAGIVPDIEVANGGKEDHQLHTAHAILKEALALASQRKQWRQRGATPIDSAVIKEVGRGLLASPPPAP